MGYSLENAFLETYQEGIQPAMPVGSLVDIDIIIKIREKAGRAYVKII
jgi:hypothetical protein